MLRVVLVVSLLINLIACSSTSEWKGVYNVEKKEVTQSKLEVPPDLSQPTISHGLSVPNIASGGSTYSAYSHSHTENISDNVAAANPAGVKVVRDGYYQWLEINATAEKLWPELTVFFTEVGFEIKFNNKALGIVETNWVENRLNFPTNWFTKILGKISTSGLKDRYRARLEKTDNPKVTRLYITHQGLEITGTDTSGDGNFETSWQRRKSDPELEAEMYQRFLIFRDVDKTKAKNLVAKITAKERARIIEKDDTKMLQVSEGFARTWRRVGIALDRIGLFVDDRNRSGGLYYLHITDDFRDKVKEDKGWLASLFSGDSVKLKERYLLRVTSEKDSAGNPASIISLYETTGAKADSRFVSKLMTDLKSYLD